MNSRTFQPANIPFREPITIKCRVEGKDLLAKVVALTNDPIQTGFVIKFSDDTSVTATGCEDSGKFEANSPLYSPYIDAIQKELFGFSMVMDSEWHKFETKYKEENILVWVGVKEDKEYNYTIYFDGSYQFELRKKDGQWQSRSVRVIEPNPINQDIVNLVVGELESFDSQ